MKLKIVTVPDPILNQKTKPVEKIDRAILNLVKDMIKTCKAAQGIGLAAPQVGKSLRVCIINLEHMGIPAFALINPKITKKSWKKSEMEEGCLSIPDFFGMVKRPVKIKVKALNLGGEEKEVEAEGLLGRVIQHEVDHLDGILITSKFTRRTDKGQVT